MKKKFFLILLFYGLRFTVYAQNDVKNYRPGSHTVTYSYGGIVRADSTKKEIALKLLPNPLNRQSDLDRFLAKGGLTWAEVKTDI